MSEFHRSMHEELRDRLIDVLQGEIVFMGMGNVLRGDDGLGPLLLEKLRERGALVVDAGTVPENHIGSVRRLNPDTVLIIDAVHLEREPGAAELLQRDEILEHAGFTTHNLSPALVMERLEAETGATIYMLAVQPESTEFGQPLSRCVQDSIDVLADIIPVNS